eukprot:GHRR01002371.1.p1 GENE.GHRR01002371.1~~GHRR01002371.1.p1  ORF type:complete len:185 (+),score=28.34 GHRR01002371.1:1088-1642(+)
MLLLSRQQYHVQSHTHHVSAPITYGISKRLLRASRRKALAGTRTGTASWLDAINPFGRTATLPKPVAVPSVSALELEQRLQAVDTALIVIFSATWCGPCKVMMKRLEQMSQQDGLSVVKVDTDECPELASKLGIHKLPTMMFCGSATGKPTVQMQGLVPESVLSDMITNKCGYLGNDLQNYVKW